MIVWFISISIASIMLLIFLINEDDDEPGLKIGLLMLVYGFFGIIPSFIHTYTTKITKADPKEYKIIQHSKYSMLIISDLGDENPHTRKITDAYTIDIVKQNKFRVVKHEHKDMWGFEATSSNYFILPNKK